MPRREPEPGDLAAGDCHVDVALEVATRRARPAPLDQAEALQLARQVGRDPRPLAELVQLDLRLLLAERERPAPAAVAHGRRRELLADHPQGQELAALQAQHGAQPLDVVLAVEPVAALRAPRRDQALILEVADLGDRDVREVVAQRAAHGADREAALVPARGHGGHQRRKVSRYFPICPSSPFSSSTRSTRVWLTKVPLRLPWSSIEKRPPSSTSTAWRRETVTSSRKTSQSGERPITVRAPDGTKCSPARPPPERTTSAGPSTAMSGASAPSLASSSTE